MANGVDHVQLIRECLGQHRQAIVTTGALLFHVVAQRYSKRVSLPFSPAESDKVYCVWQDDSGHQHAHIAIEQLRFVRAL